MVESLQTDGGIIVAPARETRAVVVPFEAAHFLLVVLVLDTISVDARISWLKNHRIPTPDVNQ
jgi:hypothetical protein